MNNLSTAELNFLFELSMIFSSEKEFSKISKLIEELFKTTFHVKHARIYVKDEQIMLTRNFESNNITENSEIKKIYKTIKALKKTAQKSFLLNGTLFTLPEKPAAFLDEIDRTIREKDNILHIPLADSKNVIGILELKFDSINEIISFYSFLLSVSVASYQISSVISNYLLHNQMQTNIKFHSAMKNIAKIIESQYEFTYIIPLIGEMIDRFVPDHLVYVFIKNKNKEYELVWPSFCHDKTIFMMLKKIKYSTEYILSADKKIGVFALTGEKQVIGAIVAYSNIDKLLPNEIDYIQQLSKQSSITIQRAERYAEVLQHAALDALTSLNNRRQFEVRLNQEVATAIRKNKPLCCIMLDVDYFKKVNDSYGHVAGDCILKSLAQLILKELREYDIASRYGGEEFCILLPYTNIEEAHFVAQRLRKAVEEHRFDITEAKIPNTQHINITVSIGVSSFDSKKNSAIDLYKNADSALYEAKKRGRNKVVISSD